ncbi:MAG: TolB family protein [Candidatus Limisoma sp.]
MKRFTLTIASALLLIATSAQAQKTGTLTNITRLTNGTERYENPRWSPDGGKIAFTKLGYEGLLVMDADGTNKKMLSQGAGEGYDFKWSIDSREILVRDTRWLDKGDGLIDRAHAIWAVTTDGKKTRMTYDRPFMKPAAWRYSANGTKSIAAPDAKLVDNVNLSPVPASMRKRAAANTNNINLVSDGVDLYLVNAEGNVSKIYEGVALCETLSPNGKKVAFVNNDEIIVMNLDGTGKVNLGRGFNPSWVANSQIVFEKTTDNGHDFTSGELYIINIDGSGLKALTNDASQIKMNPCVSADGSKLVFTCYTDGQIYCADLK